MKIIQNLKMELNKTIETLKRTQTEIKMALNYSLDYSTQGKTLKVE